MEELTWRAMNQAIELWRNRGGPELGWGGGALNSFSCFTATHKQTALGPSDGPRESGKCHCKDKINLDGNLMQSLRNRGCREIKWYLYKALGTG